MDRKNVLALWKKVSSCIADEITNNDEFANRMGLIFEANLVTTDSSDNETAAELTSNIFAISAIPTKSTMTPSPLFILYTI